MSGFPLGGVKYPSISVEVSGDEPVFIFDHHDALSFVTLESLQIVASEVHAGERQWHDAFDNVYIKHLGQPMELVTPGLEDHGGHVKVVLRGETPEKIWAYDV